MTRLLSTLCSFSYGASFAYGEPTPTLANMSTEYDFNWVAGGRGKGACNGPVAQQAPAVILGPNRAISLHSDDATQGSCVYRTSDQAIDLNVVKRIEFDVKTSGRSGEQWFSLWLDPAGYVQPPSVSGEIDMIENYDNVLATNFAGCAEGWACHRDPWGIPGNAVNHHVTLVYDTGSTKASIYRCGYGASTCPRSGGAFIQLDQFRAPNRAYFLVADIWNTVPGEGFTFEVSNMHLYDTESAPDIVV